MPTNTGRQGDRSQPAGCEETVTSLARFVLDTIDQLQRMSGAGAADPKLAWLSIREVTFSLPYDPGPSAEPLPFPPGSVISLARAKTSLVALDRKVTLRRDELLKAPAGRIVRLDLKVRLAE
jgi:hypothetical protein